MAQGGTAERAGLPVPVGPVRHYAPAERELPPAAFLSQLIAERQHLATQRLRRRGSVGEAMASYSHGGELSDLRMPAGYRRTVVA